MSAKPDRALECRIAWLLYFAFPRMAGVKKHPPITLEMLLLEMEGLLRRRVIDCAAAGLGRGYAITFERTRTGQAHLENALTRYRPALPTGAR